MLKRAIHWGAAVITVAAVTVGCAAPEYTYVKNAEQKTYFKVPHDWHQLPTGDLDDYLTGSNPNSASSAIRQRMWWSVAYDAAAIPDPVHLTTSDVTDEPIVYARVAQLTEPQQNAVSLDMLRDMFLPVTEDAREAQAANTQLTGFELLSDEVLTPSDGTHGVRVVYNYEITGVMHTFDLTALVNNTADRLYLLFIRCSTSCYRERTEQLDTIATSFTVRSK
ncbi:hypothetical protein ACTOB_002124 [Actinoplanes oblitus]|uniref:PsbP C-terminal domain-containing protein n=1 Tax=Actinoplanes oblitus TaxID=3040509 RepID=A0ABY8WN39_9ACTN|nr:hypothetical protein [Actinoplanes oblitus]WIM98523.1 hypothetical protein ACTOB_002124 [Actinoplanes oblitus]